MRLVYSADAIADLDRLRRFIAEHDPGAALRTVDALIDRTERLADHPAMGRLLDGVPVSLAVREFVFGDYVVRYMLAADALIVLRAWHHREDGRSAT